jgi:hypothetical protein
MSDSLPPIDFLRGTAYVASLARRAALESSDQAVRDKALRLTSVTRELKQLAQSSPTFVPTGATASSPEFQTLINAASKKFEPSAANELAPAFRSSPLDRVEVALNMAQGGANPIEIAKSLGLSRGEVDLILNIASQK